MKSEDKKLGKSVKIYSRTKISSDPCHFTAKQGFFIRKTRQTKICLVTITMHVRCTVLIHSDRAIKSLVVGGRGYFCARDEMSTSFWNLRAWNLYMSPLICCWSMKSTKCFFCYQKYVLNLTHWLKNSWVKFPLSDLICYSRIHHWQTSNNKGIEAMFDRRLNGWPHIILSMPWLSQRSHCFKVSVQLKPLR